MELKSKMIVLNNKDVYNDNYDYIHLNFIPEFELNDFKIDLNVIDG